ncbi:SRPBCC family protein [Prauserella alba]|uniref:SRPBCC family protein n=1 Tax=Prauserella alba TaxID=176898 RepID=A0ABN1VMP3_9PSEU|nr:SRPBCC family protein [Prauserella alba]MCP2180975.1 Carbon monoxide dehydrogenase subunit G [Prauserella alba]
MILEHEISVPAPPHEVFTLLGDVERVAGCVPGAAVEGREPETGGGEAYRGRVKVKVGPISAEYTGVVRFLDVDDTALSLRLQGRGADAHGNGDAEAEVLVTLIDTGGGTTVSLKTDLVIRGKIAQFGKGAINKVSDRILEQFAVNLAALLAGDGARVQEAAAGGVTPHPATESSAPTATTPASAPSELDGLALVAGPLAKYLPVAGAFAIGLAQGWLLATVRSQAKQLKEVRRVRS